MAESVAGTRVVLPADRFGQPFVAIFGFSEKGGEAPPGVVIYAVADLSRVPGLFRGFAISGIRKEASPTLAEQHDHVLMLTHGNNWSQIVPSGSDEDAVIVAVDQTGTITAIERRAFSAAAAADIAKAIASPP